MNENRGDYNCCNYSGGFLGSVETFVTSFDEPTEYTWFEYKKQFGNLVSELGSRLNKYEPISVEEFKAIPNITQEKLDALHKKFIEFREPLVFLPAPTSLELP
jgi:hypothetical protein